MSQANLLPVLVQTPAMKYQRQIEIWMVSLSTYDDESLKALVSDYRDARVGTEDAAIRDAAQRVLGARERLRHNQRVRENERHAASKTAPAARMRHF